VSDVDDALARWVDAGLIEPERAARIREFERSQAPRAASPSAAEDRPGALEVMLYLGFVVLGVGVFALIAQQWDELESWARIAATGVPVGLLLLAGVLLRLSGEGPLERGGQAAWFVAVPLFAGALGVVINEYGPESSGGGDDRSLVLLVASATLALALVLWAFSAAHAQVLAVAGSAAFFAQALGAWPDDFSAGLAGFVMFAIGAAGLALAEVGWFAPKPSARFCFAVLAVAGPYQAGFVDSDLEAYEFLSFVAAAGVIALGVWRASFALVLVGVVGIFVALVTFIFEHFEDELGAPLALMLSGGLLVAAVLTLAFLRNESRKRKAASA
jgi:hypothetical protein